MPELDDLPNGLHDTVVRDIRIDFAAQQLEIDCDVLVGTPDGATENEQEARRLARIALRGVTAVRIDPPRPGYVFATGAGLLVDGGLGAYPGDPPLADDGLVHLWLFVSTWNARMQFTGDSFEVTWVE